VLPLLRMAGKDRAWQQLEAGRRIPGPDQPVLVKTFCLSDRLDIQRSLIVLRIKETARTSSQS
jgi:hypothetical protein